MSASLAEPSELGRFVEASHRAPALPYRSLAPFRFADAGILVGRDGEVERLVRLITMFRGVLLYGESGAGKSSVVNAGVLPRLIEDGFWPHRIRVQPRDGQEFVLEPIASSDGGGDSLLPSAFDGAAADGRLVAGADEFAATVGRASERGSILLVFDQFEELVTLFPRARAITETQARILNSILRLLRDETLRVKLLFVFREDYLASLKPLLEEQPELAHQSLRLVAPPMSCATEIIRAPFERFPSHYERELSPALAERVAADLARHSQREDLSLSELQIVSSRLWDAPDPSALLEKRKVAGLLEDHLDEALKAFPPSLQAAALAVLVQMITASGTRNVVAAQDLVQRAREEQPRLSAAELENAIERLERETGLIRRERRHDVDLYELTSEFLIPRISERRQEMRLAGERRRERRRNVILSSIAATAVGVLAVVAVLTVIAFDQAHSAQQQRANATYLGLASRAQALVPIRPDVSALLALAAYLHVPKTSSRTVARSSLMSALDDLSRSGAAGVLHGHDDTVTDVAFDPAASDVFASSSGDGTIRLWSTRTHRQLSAPLRGPPGGVFGLAFSRDGRILASAHEDGSVRLWDVGSRRALGEVSPRLPGIITEVAFSPDGGTLAAVSLNGAIALWRLVDDKPAGQPLMLRDPMVRSIAYSPDSHTLAAAGNSGVVTLWDTGNGRRLGKPRHFNQALYTVTFRPGGNELATAGLSGEVWLWNFATRARPEAITGNGSTVQDLAFSPDGSILAVARSDETVATVDVAGRAPVTVLSGHGGVVTSVAFSPSGQLLASGSADRTIRLWNLLPHRGFGGALTPTSRFASGVAISHDGSTLATGTAGPSPGVRLWNAKTGDPIGRLPSSYGEVRSVAFSPDDRLLASASQGGEVQLWTVGSGQAYGRPIFLRPGVAIYSVAFSPRHHMLAFAGAHGTLELWNLSDGHATRLPVPSDVPVYSVAFSSDGDLLASGGDDRVIRLWRVTTGGQVGTLEGDTDAIFALAFSPRGHTLASGSADDTVRLWNVNRLEQIGEPLTGHNRYVRSVAFSSDGRTLVSGSTDGTVRFWDVASMTLIGEPLSANHSSIEGVALAPGDASLATAGGDGATRLWAPVSLPDNLQRLQREVCGMVGGGLGRAEWSQYASDLPYERICS